ncbi:SAP domain-containing protein [Cryptosporidium felis]|nr:SAP domain-containing protein [Cryptosporidium felis]
MNYSTLKIDELKELLKERGLSATGRKALLDYDSQQSLTKTPAKTKEDESLQETEKARECEMKIDEEEGSFPDADPSGQTICISDVNRLSEKERIELRRQKFGVCEPTSESEKRLARSRRFGTTSERDKLKIRQERFGMASEDEKIRNRRERFGTSSQPYDPEHERKIQARKLRFGLK